MFDVLHIRAWHRAFSPFVCSACGRPTTYAVEADGQAAEGGSAVRAAVCAPPALSLRCDHCGGLTRFPRARLEHIAEIGEAVGVGVSLHLPVRACSACGGRGLRERLSRSQGRSPDFEDPCSRCEGAGFVWPSPDGASLWSYRRLLSR